MVDVGVIIWFVFRGIRTLEWCVSCLFQYVCFNVLAVYGVRICVDVCSGCYRGGIVVMQVI